MPAKVDCTASRQCFEGFLSTLTDVYYQTNMEGTITSVSPSCFAHLGYLGQEMIGRKMAEFYASAADRDIVLSEFQKNNGQITHVEAALRHKDGQQVWASTDACVRYDQSGAPAYIEGISRNITERKNLEESLNQAIVDQKLLIQVLCHDLKNPIGNAISLLSMDDPSLLIEYQAKITQSLQSGLEMIDMINRMSHFSLSDKIDLGPVDLSAAIYAAAENLEQKARAKQIQLEINSETLHVLAEPVSISNSVIANALSNAIKFSERGAKVEIVAYKIGPWAEVTISDHGVGMEPSIADNLFDFSQKVNRQGTEGESGTGHGLKLAKFFVEKYGGSIAVDSVTKAQSDSLHGTAVKFRLKLAG